MSWLNYEGKTPAELTAGARIDVGAMPHIQPRQNQWAEALKQIAPAVMAYLKQRKNDEIANQVQNMMQPPRAESVDPSLQGAPATRPQTGGVDAMQAQQMYQKLQDQQAANTPDTAMNDLQYQHLYRQTYPEQFPQSSPKGKYAVQGPDGQTYYVTGNAALRASQPPKPSYTDVEQQTGHKWAEWNQLAESDLANIGTDPGDPNQLRGHFRDKQGNQSDASIPVQLFQDAQRRANRGGASGQAGGSTAAASESVVGASPQLPTSQSPGYQQPASTDQKNYPVGTKARKGDQWFVMTDNGWKPAVP